MPIIIAVALIAVVAAAGYVVLRTETFETRGSVRLNPVVAEGAATGEIGGLQVDIGTEIITSPTILEVAAASAGEDVGVLAAAIDVELIEDVRTAHVSISAEASSAEGARERVEAVIEAYRAYVDEQIDAVRSALEERRTAAVAAATEYQNQVAANPSNSIAATNLTTALGQMSAARAQIDDINNAGPATAVLRVVPDGTSQVPSAVVVLALALLTGLIVGMGAALIRDQFDDRLRPDDDIQTLSGATGLGELSWDRSVARARSAPMVAADSRTDLSEGLRTLRSTLQVLLGRRDGVVVVTSVEPGDGKSFVSVNLALAWARSGRNVVLVGGDMRRPDLGRYFGEAAYGEGLAEILDEAASSDGAGDVDVTSRLNATQYRRLRILPSGSEPRDPADLLAHSRLEDIVRALRSEADIVVIDSPPALGMSDAALLSAYADGAIVIATIGRTDRNRLIDAVAALRAGDVNIWGVVANGSRRRLPHSYSSYHSAGGRTSGLAATRRGRTVREERS